MYQPHWVAERCDEFMHVTNRSTVCDVASTQVGLAAIIIPAIITISLGSA